MECWPVFPLHVLGVQTKQQRADGGQGSPTHFVHVGGSDPPESKSTGTKTSQEPQNVFKKR